MTSHTQKMEVGDLVQKLQHGNESEISEILDKLNIGWYDSQIVERIMYQKSVEEKLGIIKELVIHSTKLKECMEGYIPTNNTNVCPKVFDGWTCWNETAAGMTAVSSCPSTVPGFDPNTFANTNLNLNSNYHGVKIKCNQAN